MPAPDSGNPSFRSRSRVGQVETARDQFAAAWKAGNRPQIEDFLKDVTEPDRSSLLRELLLIEWQHRQLAGETPTVEEYRSRFPDHGAVLSEVAATSETTVGWAIKQDTDHPRPATNSPQGGSIPKLPGYEILGVLGRGGMGIVYQARDVHLKRLVAIKMIRTGADAHSEELTRFRTEAEAIARLQHPHIVQVHAVGEHERQPFVVLEFVDGGSLHQKLSGTPLPPREAARIVKILAQAMQDAHDHGIIHRDLKPANVLLTADGIPKITDFGLAKKLEDESGQTQTGAVMGTPSYMSPEQAAGRTSEIGPSTDIYALGAILYELLTGRPPFKAATAMVTLRQVLDEDPVAPRQLNPAIDRDVETIALKCLDKLATRRYATANELAHDIRRYLAGEPIQARSVTSWERAWRWSRRNPAISLLTASVLIVLVTGIAVSSGFAMLWKKEASNALTAMIRANAKTDEALQSEAHAVEKTQEALRQKKRADDKAEEARDHSYDSDMLLAQSHWDANQLKPALELLDRWEPASNEKDRRGWEWHYLARLCRSEIRICEAYSQVKSVAYSPDGRMVAMGSISGTLTLSDTGTGGRVGFLIGHKGSIDSVAFSPDGQRIVTAGSDRSIRIWDVAKQQEICSMTGHDHVILSVAFSPNGQQVASGSGDATVRLWDAATGRGLKSLKGHASGVSSIAYRPDGLELASAGTDRTIRLWNASTGQMTKVLNSSDAVRSIAYRPDGLELLVGGDEPDVKLLVISTGVPRNIFKGHTRAINRVAFSPNGKWIASASEDWTVRLWDVNTGEEIRSFKGHTRGASDVAFSPDGQRLVTACWETPHAVKIWDLGYDSEFRVLAGHDHRVSSLAFHPHGKLLATAGLDGTVKFWNLKTGQETRNLIGHNGALMSIAFSPNGQYVANGGSHGVEVWDSSTGELLETLDGHQRAVNCVAFRNNQQLASASDDQTVKLWDIQSRQPFRTLSGHEGRVTSVAFSPDGQEIVAAGEKGIMLWNCSTGKQIHDIPGKGVNGVAFSPDGTRFATANGYETVTLWDRKLGQEFRTVKGHTLWVWNVAYSPDGRRLASASGDETVQVRDANTGQGLRTLKGHSSWARCVAFSPNSQWLAIGYEDGAVRLADARPATPKLKMELEAHSLVEFLMKVVPKGEVIARIEKHRGINEQVRQSALAVIQEYKNSSDKYQAGHAMPVASLSPQTQAASNFPQLISPKTNSTLPNGTPNGKTRYTWDFDWKDVPNATRYHLRVQKVGAARPVINLENLQESRWRDTSTGYVSPAGCKGWGWKVCALVNGEWTEWSEEWKFDVELSE